MKKIILASLLFVIITSIHSFADTKTVTINWSTSGATQEIQSYKMIYSYSSNMANPIDACETSDSSVNSLTCKDIQITTPEVYFQIIATTDQQSMTASNIQHVIIPLSLSSSSIVQDFRVITSYPVPPADIFDNFSTNTSANYSFISGSMFIENGQAHGQSWRNSIGYHTSTLGKADQSVSATCSFSGSDYSGVAARVNPSNQTGYFVSIRLGDVTLHSFSGSSTRWIADASHPFSSPVKVELIVTGENMVVKLNNTVQISTTDTTFSTGNFCGPIISRGYSNADITIDNLEGTAQ